MKKFIFATLLAAAACSLMLCAKAYAQEKTISSGSTLNDLMAAYNAESNSKAKYEAFAKKANAEGYDALASLFRAGAMAEQVHMERHADIIKKLGGTPKAEIKTPVVRSTKENLEEAMEQEAYESAVIYPEYLKQAEKEGIEDAIAAFMYAKEAEAAHTRAYAKMLNNIDLSKGLTKAFYVCPLCGNILDALVLRECPICGTNKEKFRKIAEY
ncbi:MAG: rubrerythrin family protein [Candidatus Omnitrophica bacterium]|nr:rubrerythrin family protein [Candidatus Omnitrophota bacterium]